MDEITQLKESINKLAAAGVDLEKAAEATHKAVGDFNLTAESITELLNKINPPEGVKTLDNSQITEVSRLLETSFSFKPTAMIADFLRRKGLEFEDMNNFQIGILLSKCGYKSGHNSKSRGYYVKYTEL